MEILCGRCKKIYKTERGFENHVCNEASQREREALRQLTTELLRKVAQGKLTFEQAQRKLLKAN